MTKEFVHLHSHTEYSMLDGAVRIPDLMQTVKDAGMHAVAITDHGNMFGAVEFYKAAHKAGVKPIIGCEVYVAPGDRRDKKVNRELGEENAYHMLLLVQDEEGYRNLCRLVTRAYFEGYHYKPRVDLEILREHSAGLIATSTCLQGMISKAILHNERDKVRNLARTFSEIYPDRFYLELQENGVPEQKIVNEAKMGLAKELGLPLVATNDNHYLCHADHATHDLLLAMSVQRPLDDPDRFKFPTDEFWVKPPEVMWENFAYCPEALENTLRIAEKCDYTFEFGQNHLPNYDADIEDTGAELNRQTWVGFEERMQELGIEGGARKEYEERLTYELEVVNNMGFPGYFLIVSDFIKWAKDEDIPIGPGRGSAAGSLASYCLRITDLDPLKYDLLFERFLNPDRIGMPDIDVDICMDGREQVIKYVTDKYGGEDHVAQISTFARLKAKNAIKDVGRALEVPYGDTDKLCKLIGDELGITLEKAYNTINDFRAAIDSNPTYTRLYNMARDVEGAVRNSGIHAAGIVITDRPLTDYAPLWRGKNGETVVQYEKDTAEEIGLIKFDFLGLKNLTILDRAVKMVERYHDTKIDLDALPLDDPKVFKLLQAGEGMGVFQLESQGMRGLLKRLRPSVFEDIIAILALYRPGPLGSGIVDDYVKRKHGELPITYMIDALEPILKETYGMLIYQEQIMRIATDLAGFTMAEADELRKVVAKKIAEKMAPMVDRLINGMVERGHNKKKCEELVNMIKQFAEYGFNKSHSAAYAVVAYRTAWMKAHYPLEYRAALMSTQDNIEDVIKFINEARSAGIEVMAPDANLAEADFSVREGKIIFGLASVRNLGAKAVENLLEIREEHGPFSSYLDLIKLLDSSIWNRRKVEACIESGAFDVFGLPRSQMYENLDTALSWAEEVRKQKETGQASLFGGASGEVPSPDLKEVEPWTMEEKLSRELGAIGFYFSGNPLDPYKTQVRKHTNMQAADLEEIADRFAFQSASVIQKVQSRTTKDGRRYANVQCQDYTGIFTLYVGAKLYEQQEIQDLLEPGKCIFATGTVAVDDGGREPRLFTNGIMPLHDVEAHFANEVYFRLNDDTLEDMQIYRLQALLRANPGQSAVRVDVVRAGEFCTRVELGSQYRCIPVEKVTTGIREILGEDIALRVG